MIEEIGEHLVEIKKMTDAMTDARRKANVIIDTKKKSEAYCQNVKPYFDVIRTHSDKLEKLIDDQLWPLTKYRELLLIK
jgi:glutamine synthetase